MSDPTGVAHRYIRAWNERDAEARGKLLRELFTDDARYTDPLVDADGRAAIDDAIGTAHAMFPDFTFRLVGAVDAHHEQMRFSWELGPEEGVAPVAGSDVAVGNGNGRIHRVLGFLDRVPAA